MRLVPWTCLTLCALAATSLAGQVPDGWMVGAHFQLGAPGGGPGGLVIAHPRSPSIGAYATGLGADLTGSGTSGVTQGANSVLYRPSDGALIVGEIAPASEPSVDIHVVHLSNSFAAVSDVAWPIGTTSSSASPGSGAIDQMAWLPNGNILFTTRDIVSPVLGSETLGVLDPTTGSFAPIPVTGTSGVLNALAIDATGTIAYLGFVGAAAGQSAIYRVPVPAGGAATLVGMVGGNILQLTVDLAGFLVAGLQGGSGDIVRMAPTTGMTSIVTASLLNVAALTIEPATGNYVAISIDPNTAGAYWLTPQGQETLVVSATPNPPSIPAGVTMVPNPHPFGAGTQGVTSVQFEISPNPGGLPQVGNQAFGLSYTSSPQGAPALFAISSAPAALTISGLSILIDPNQLVILQPLPAGPTVSVALPIPNAAILQDVSFFCQVLVDAGGSLTTSSGLRVTVL